MPRKPRHSFLIASTPEEMAVLMRKYGPALSIAAELQVSRSTAYRYMEALPKVYIYDQTTKQKYRCVELRLVRRLHMMQKRGNPLFKHSAYQAYLRSRRTP